MTKQFFHSILSKLQKVKSVLNERGAVSLEETSAALGIALLASLAVYTASDNASQSSVEMMHVGNAVGYSVEAMKYAQQVGHLASGSSQTVALSSIKSSFKNTIDPSIPTAEYNPTASVFAVTNSGSNVYIVRAKLVSNDHTHTYIDETSAGKDYTLLGVDDVTIGL